MTQIRLRLFGAFSAQLNDKYRLLFRTDKIRALLTYLILEGERPHRRSSLATLLWPEMDDSASLKNLRMSLSRLRQTIEPVLPEPNELLNVTRQTIQLNPQLLDVDVPAFQSLLIASENHAHRHLHLCQSCLEQLTQAAELYQGELLEGLSLTDAQPFEEWLRFWRERLQHQAMLVLYNLAAAFAQRGEHEKALAYAARQVVLDPYYEEAHRQMMRALAGSGRRHEALMQYERCRTLLAQDLGVEPTAETKALYEAITHQVQEGKETSSLITLSAPVILHHFPTQLSAFFGRESELNKIQEMLLDPDCRLLTLIGMGGVGKTRLCIQAAQLKGVQDHFRDGIYFFPLTTTNAADALLTKLANGLGITFDGRDDPWLQIRDYLRDRRSLLVLDNFEQLVDNAPMVAEILGEAPDVRLLVTSRRPLNLRLERRLTIEGLSFPPVDQPLTDILSYSAVQLFVETARHGASGFSLSAENEEDVARICQNVQGIPLALEMAASWTSLMNCAAIAAEINRNLDFLTSRHQDLPERHRNLRAVFSASFDQLSPSQQATLAKFSVFRGPVDLEAILAITEVTMGDVAHLLDMTLLRTTHQGRYELHELLRQFAAEKLVEMETADKSKGETAARHSDYYLAFIARHEARLYGLESADAQKLLLDQLENIEAAWQWAVEAGHLQELLSALEGLSYFYELSTLFQRAATVFSQAVQHLIQTRETAEAVDLSLTSVLCQVQVHQAYFFELCGEIDKAFQTVESALKLTRRQSHSQDEADALSLLGSFLPHRGQFELGIQYLEQAISYYETVDQERSLAIALNRLGIVNWRHARYEPALEAFFRALDIYQSLGDKLRLARLHDTIAGVYWEKRERDKTMVYIQKGLALFESTGNKIGIATILAHLALIHTALGQFNLALEHSEKSIAICREVGNRYNLSIDLGNRASIYEAMGNFEQALVHYEEALKIDKALGDEWRIAYHRSGITYSLMQLGRYEEALDCLDQAVPVLKAHGARYYTVEPMINMAQIYFIQKRYDLVRPLVEEVQALARELNIRHSHLEGDILLAKLDFVAGQEQRAIEQLETLLAETQDENEQGQLHYELWKMGGESLHQQAAIQLYKAAYQRVPNYENKTRLVELEGDLSNQLPV